MLKLEFKKDDKFEDLGSFKDFFSQYGNCTVSIDNIDDLNIPLTVISSQEIEFRIYCSNSLSRIIKEEEGFPEGMENYRLLRIKKYDGQKYIRVSQSIDIDGSQEESIVIDLQKKLKGNQRLTFKVDDL